MQSKSLLIAAAWPISVPLLIIYKSATVGLPILIRLIAYAVRAVLSQTRSGRHTAYYMRAAGRTRRRASWASVRRVWAAVR